MFLTIFLSYVPWMCDCNSYSICWHELFSTQKTPQSMFCPFGCRKYSCVVKTSVRDSFAPASENPKLIQTRSIGYSKSSIFFKPHKHVVIESPHPHPHPPTFLFCVLVGFAVGVGLKFINQSWCKACAMNSKLTIWYLLFFFGEARAFIAILEVFNLFLYGFSELSFYVHVIFVLLCVGL